MSNILEYRKEVISEYALFSRSFTRINAADIISVVDGEYAKGRYWPEPLIQINPNYRRGKEIDELVDEGLLHSKCAEIFRFGGNQPLRLFQHQQEALSKATRGESYVVTVALALEGRTDPRRLDDSQVPRLLAVRPRGNPAEATITFEIRHAL
jgi:hypothetical protein